MHNVQDMQDRQERQAGAGPLLTADQVQRLLDLDRSTVYRMAGDGRLPAVKIGRQWRFPADRIDQILRLDEPRLAAVDPEPVLSAEVAQPVVDVTAATLGVMMVVTDMEGRPLTEVANPNRWFASRDGDDAVVQACTAEWRMLADDLDFEPRFRLGHLGFECARAYIRSGDRLVGMVLAGGVAPDGAPAGSPDGADLYHLDDEQRRQVLRTLPLVAAVLSRASARTPTNGRRADATAEPR